MTKLSRLILYIFYSRCKTAIFQVLVELILLKDSSGNSDVQPSLETTGWEFPSKSEILFFFFFAN